MQQCLHDIHLECCLIYLDGINVYSPSFEQHLEDLGAVFSHLAKFGLCIKHSKCQFLKPYIRYFGHVVSKDGVKLSQARFMQSKA